MSEGGDGRPTHTGPRAESRRRGFRQDASVVVTLLGQEEPLAISRRVAAFTRQVQGHIDRTDLFLRRQQVRINGFCQLSVPVRAAAAEWRSSESEDGRTIGYRHIRITVTAVTAMAEEFHRVLDWCLNHGVRGDVRCWQQHCRYFLSLKLMEADTRLVKFAAEISNEFHWIVRVIEGPQSEERSTSQRQHEQDLEGGGYAP